MISIRIHISARIVHVRYPHTHIRILLVAEAVTSPRGYVNALANDHPVILPVDESFTSPSRHRVCLNPLAKYFGKYVNSKKVVLKYSL